MSEIKGKFREFVFRLYHEAVNELALIEKMSISCESRRKKVLISSGRVIQT